jgi:hypothetical protein
MNRQTKDDKHVAVFKYGCGFCGEEFKRLPGFSAPHNQFGKTARHGGCSDQVRCPGCGNFLRTWDDAQKS